MENVKAIRACLADRELADEVISLATIMQFVEAAFHMLKLPSA